jgi:hypothetical protein
LHDGKDDDKITAQLEPALNLEMLASPEKTLSHAASRSLFRGIIGLKGQRT